MSVRVFLKSVCSSLVSKKPRSSFFLKRKWGKILHNLRLLRTIKKSLYHLYHSFGGSSLIFMNFYAFFCRNFRRIQDSLASLARRMRVDMSCFSKTCQHLPHRIRAHPRGAFILHRGIVPTMKRVSLFARVSHD